MEKLEIEYLPISEIVPYSKNPRKNDQAVDVVAKSIKEFGFKNPIILDKDNTIIAGHTRLKAAIKLGLQEVPIIWADELTEDQVKAFRLMDNKSIEYSNWDYNLLKDEFYALENTDAFNFTGFTSDEISKIWDKETKEDDFQIPKEPKYDIKEGELWQLGEHRLYCGDATKKEDVEALMGEQTADMVFTDPPYGIDIVGKGKVGVSGDLGFKGGREIGVSMLAKAGKYKEIIGDDKPFDPTFLLNYGKIQIIWGANHFASKLPDNSHWLVWDKKCERGADHNNFSDCELAWTNVDKKAVRVYRYLWSGLLREGDRNTELSKRVHPTQKPVGLMSEIIKDYSKNEEKIMDLFGGSGSTLIACEQLNRKCYMMEIDAYYCSIIIERWEKLTSKKGVKIGN